MSGELYSNDPFGGRRAKAQGVPRKHVHQRAPTANDKTVDIGDIWVDSLLEKAYVCSGKSGGVTTWEDIVGTAATTLASGISRLTTIAEAQAGTAVDIAVTPAGLAAVAIAGAPNWSESVSGIGQIATSVEALALALNTVAITPSKLAEVLATPAAIGTGTPAAGTFAALTATGLLTVGASMVVTTGATTSSIGADASTGAINFGTGAGARTITVGNITGATAVAINSGTGHITLTSTGAGDVVVVGGDKITLDAAGTVDINSSAAAINIGNDDIDQAVNIATDGERALTIGSNNGAASVDVVGGTGGINVGANAIAQSVTVGNITGASALALLVGTGNFTLEGATASTYTVSGTGVNTGAIVVGGGTGARTASFNVGAAAKTTVVGSVTTTSTTTINAGSGKIQLVGNVVLATAGTGLTVNGGAATDSIGQVTLTSGTVTVSNTNITAASRIFLTRRGVNASTALGELNVSAITGSTSFVITSQDLVTPGDTETGDASTVDYFIVEQS